MDFLKNIFLTIWYVIWPISPIELLFTVFALFAWSRVILKFRAKLMNQKELAFWSVIWLSIILLLYIPGKTTTLANLLGMGRGLDAMLFSAVVLLFYAVYRLYIKANESEREMTELIRQIALRLDVKQNQPKRSKK